eukprot:675798-Amphidinium_carterae.1
MVYSPGIQETAFKSLQKAAVEQQRELDSSHEILENEMQNKPKHIHTHHTRSSDVAVTSVDVVPEEGASSACSHSRGHSARETTAVLALQEESGYRILLGFQDASIGITSMDVDAVSREHEEASTLDPLRAWTWLGNDLFLQQPVARTVQFESGAMRQSIVRFVGRARTRRRLHVAVPSRRTVLASYGTGLKSGAALIVNVITLTMHDESTEP